MTDPIRPIFDTNRGLVCLGCGECHKVKGRMETWLLARKVKAFENLHSSCREKKEVHIEPGEP